MKVFEITESGFGDVMSFARKAKEAICALEECLAKSSSNFSGHNSSAHHTAEPFDYRDYERFKAFMEAHPEHYHAGAKAY